MNTAGIGLFFCLTIACAAAQPVPPVFIIQVSDRATTRGVPLVELETVNHERFVTDNNGIIVIDEPELLGRDVFFHIRSHGYRFPKDGFGYSGTRLRTTPGSTARVEIDRINIAERLFRVTGSGRFAASLRAKGIVADDIPVGGSGATPGGVVGCDSVLNAVFQNKLYWIWGDTNRLSYPLGNFDATGATSLIPDNGGLAGDPGRGIDLDYFMSEKNDGFVRGIAPIAGEGPTWLTGLATLPDNNGVDHLVATYLKVKKPLVVYRRGLCEFDPDSGVFKSVLVFPPDTPLIPEGHPFRHTIDQSAFLEFGDPFPTLRIPASYEAWKNPDTYQTVVSDIAITDAKTGTTVNAHRGSIAWNRHLEKWVAIFVETGGSPSFLGEIWFAEANQPDGPWRKAVKIATHDRYSFYNPKQHPYFSEESDRIIYFEGTYTTTFSGNDHPTPLYDYNQILYRLDVSDKRLHPPAH